MNMGEIIVRYPNHGGYNGVAISACTEAINTPVQIVLSPTNQISSYQTGGGEERMDQSN